MHDWGVMDWLTAIITVTVILGIVVLSYRRGDEHGRAGLRLPGHFVAASNPKEKESPAVASGGIGFQFGPNETRLR